MGKAHKPREPQFLIVGAGKAGTSFFRRLLNQHPRVDCLNEINYFSNDDLFPKGRSWYLSHFEALEKDVTGDKSPACYFHPAAPERIFDDLGKGIKLIWVLRDPVVRSYSDYWFSVFRGRELKSFDLAVQMELEGTRKDWYRHYLMKSDYLLHINRYRKFFDLDQMHFVLLENLKAFPQATCQEAFEFLGIENHEIELTTQVGKNPTYVPKFKSLNYLANRLFSRNILRPLFNLIRFYNRRSTPGYPKVNPQTEKLMVDYFRERNKQLAVLISKDLSIWS